MTGRTVLVTGASRGIGNAIARALLEQGYRVACGYKTSNAGADALAAEFPHAQPLLIDVAERGSVRKALARLERSPDILINNAAIADEKPFETITDGDWDLMLQTNLRGPFMLTQECLPGMLARRFGRIVNIVSIGGQWGGMRQVHYAAAKAGLINFTQSMAKLYAKDGLTSNAVSPGLVATDMAENELSSEAGQQKAAQIPVGRIARPSEIAAAVVFLVSEQAAYITGQTINVNGGMYFG
jgi:acetoacetyl-CoA reductase/3-oxoacyl-[acyl-carrier protein] reductase